MPITKKLPDSKNGFKLIKDLGLHENGSRYAIAICKECSKEFKTSIYVINKIKSCGCLPIRKAKVLESDINGFKIIKDLGYSNGSRRAICICKVCQKEYEVDPNKLSYRKHCGCIKHGVRVCVYSKTYPRLMNIYKHMIARCYRKTDQDYYNYGQRGIRVCKEWKGNPDAFCKWALENGYSNELSIDRIDFNKGYIPENCRWATAQTQARNTNRNVMTMELANEIRDELNVSNKELANKYNVSEATIYNIINNRSWK